MPMSYPDGIIKEHLHTREKAGLFDVSHMGQIRSFGENAARLLEMPVPAKWSGLVMPLGDTDAAENR